MAADRFSGAASSRRTRADRSARGVGPTRPGPVRAAWAADYASAAATTRQPTASPYSEDRRDGVATGADQQHAYSRGGCLLSNCGRTATALWPARRRMKEISSPTERAND